MRLPSLGLRHHFAHVSEMTVFGVSVRILRHGVPTGPAQAERSAQTRKNIGPNRSNRANDQAGRHDGRGIIWTLPFPCTWWVVKLCCTAYLMKTFLCSVSPDNKVTPLLAPGDFSIPVSSQSLQSVSTLLPLLHDAVNAFLLQRWSC